MANPLAPSTGRSRPRRGRPTVRAAFVVTALGAALLSACGAPPSSGGTGGRGSEATKKLPTCPLDALKTAKGTTKVDLWYGGLGGSPGGVLENMVKGFNASQDKVTVDANNQGAAYEETLRKYEGASSTPKQLPQIIYLEDTALGEMVDKGQVLPAEACMKADGYDLTNLNAAARSAFSVDGTLYPGYMNVSTLVLYYNKVHFKQAGLDPEKPPATLEELRKDAEILKEKGVSEHPLSFKNDRWYLENWLTGVHQDMVNHDNGRTSPPTKATFATKEAADTLDFFGQMKEDGLAVPFARTEGSINHYLALLPTGDKRPESSMLIETSTASSTIRDFLGGSISAAEAGSEFANADIDFDKNQIVPGAGVFPGIKKGGQIFASGGAFYILNTSSKAQQAAAWEFLKYMLQPENAYEWHTKGGYLPVVKEVLDNPEIEKFWETDVAGVMLKVAVEQLNDADPDQNGPLVGPYQDYAKQIDNVINNVMIDGAEAAPQLATAQKNVDQILDDYNN